MQTVPESKGPGPGSPMIMDSDDDHGLSAESNFWNLAHHCEVKTRSKRGQNEVKTRSNRSCSHRFVPVP
eukprot:716577-Hanusia_phi.AAC.3